MKITILGSGTCASGLPGIPNRFPPAFLAEWDNEKLLFDCSEGVRFRLEKIGVNYADIHHIAISHSHPDHNALVHFLQSTFCTGLWGGTKNEQLNIYAPLKLIEDFPVLWGIYLPERAKEYYTYPLLDFKNLPSADYRIGNGNLSAASVYHAKGLVDAVGLRLEVPEGVVVYSGDSGDCAGLREIARNADLFICDATARIGDAKAPYEYGHLHPRIIGEISKEAGVKTVVMTHHTGLDSDDAMIQDCRQSGYKGEILVAADFQVLEV
jgi:ribonuclease BN (tRNA processing enzyme)